MKNVAVCCMVVLTICLSVAALSVASTYKHSHGASNHAAECNPFDAPC